MELAQLQAPYSDPNACAGQAPLWIAVNHYVPRKPIKGKGLTLLLAHANGMHKEVRLQTKFISML